MDVAVQRGERDSRGRAAPFCAGSDGWGTVVDVRLKNVQDKYTVTLYGGGRERVSGSCVAWRVCRAEGCSHGSAPAVLAAHQARCGRGWAAAGGTR